MASFFAVIPGPLQAEPGIRGGGGDVLSSPGARSASRGSSRTCGAPVWIPARRCAPSGMTSKERMRRPG